MPTGLFFTHFRAEPWFNMGFDEWMLGSALEAPGLFIARLYSWSVGTITFGRNQRESTALNWSRAGQTPVIRRITGGRAVFHDPRELTYSLALNPHAPGFDHLAGSVTKTSAAFAEALHDFVAARGCPVSIARRSSRRDARPEVFHKAPCFVSTARYELAANGRKVVASAQRQIGGVILQHGSIKLHGVVGHPALDGLAGERTDGDPLGLSAAAFESAAGDFRRALIVRLGVSLERRLPTACEEAEIERATSAVRADPITRREAIKQLALSNSL